MNTLYKYISSIPLFFGKKAHFYVYKFLVDFSLTFLIKDPVIQHILKIVKKNDIVIDVGANLGTYAYSIANKVGYQGCVYAFEPNPDIYKYLQDNVCKAGNIIVFNKALSSTSIKSKLPFYVHTEGNGPTSSLEYYDELKKDNLLREISVDVITLDEFCADNQIKPDVIKIDVEGHEYSVLKGCERIINDYKPIIVFEFIEEFWVQKKMKNIFNMMHPKYKMQVIETKVNAYSHYKNSQIVEKGDIRQSNNVNIVCIPR